MSGYGPTNLKGCLVFIFIIPIVLILRAFRFCWKKLKNLIKYKENDNEN